VGSVSALLPRAVGHVKEKKRTLSALSPTRASDVAAAARKVALKAPQTRRSDVKHFQLSAMHPLEFPALFCLALLLTLRRHGLSMAEARR